MLDMSTSPAKSTRRAAAVVDASTSSSGRPIDFAASTSAYLEHLAPIWAELPTAARGRFYVSPWLVPRARELELDSAGFPERLPRGDLVVVAGHVDLIRAPGRPVVLAEHGAGQSYSSRHSSYAGGLGRERVVLFVVPNEQAADRNRRRYPKTPNVIAGPTYLDPWHAGAKRHVSIEGRRLAVISFHWKVKEAVSREAGSALDYFARVLAPAREELAGHGVELAGHGHPRPEFRTELEPIYERAGIRMIDRFETVLETADLYAVDNSSTLFEFASIGRPVVVLNSPRYRRNVRHGLRFWDEADVGLQVDDPDSLAASILVALADPPALRESREASIARVYPVRDGSSARRAAKGILAVNACPICHAGNCSCGPTTTTKAVDIIEPESNVTTGPKKLYPNPETGGRTFLRLTASEAARLGIKPTPGILSSAKSSSSTIEGRVEALTDRLSAAGASVEEILEARDAFLDPDPGLEAERDAGLERIEGMTVDDLAEHLEMLRAAKADELADEAARDLVETTDPPPPSTDDDTAPPTKKRDAPNKARPAPATTTKRRPKASADA